MELMDRLMRRVAKQPSGCWEWLGARSHGYGVFYAGIKTCGTSRAHRVMWHLANGPIPAGLCVCHRCDNPPCVNPEHLFLGTQADNIDDMMRKGRRQHLLGPRSATRAKLTADEVRSAVEMIRGGLSHAAVARRFGVDRKTMSFITNGKTWAHLGLDLSGIDHTKHARKAVQS